MKVESPIAVGHIPSGLFIVCVIDGQKKEGFLASWVQQVSFSPLLISVAIQKERRPYKAIMSGQFFTINVVGEHNTEYLGPFWSSYTENPFPKIPHQISKNGGILLEGAKSVMECKMLSHKAPGDHEIVFAEVVTSYVFDEKAKPKVHIRKTGSQY